MEVFSMVYWVFQKCVTVNYCERSWQMEGKKTTKNILDIFSHVCIFIFIEYLLACFLLSFTAHILNIFFLTCNAGVIINFWVKLSRIIKNKIIIYSIICLSIVVVGLILLLWGYFPVSTALRKVLWWRRLRDFLLLPCRWLCLWWLCINSICQWNTCYWSIWNGWGIQRRTLWDGF